MANYDKSTGNNGTLRMSITYSQSVANNQTTFTVKYYLINTNSATYFTNESWSGNTAGTNRSGTVSISGSGTKTLGSWTVTKTHNADGTLPTAARTFSIYLSDTGTIGVGGPTSNSVTLTIPAIPRKSSTSASSYSVTAGNAVSVGISRHSTSFTHTVRFTLGAATHSITGVGTSTSYTVPENWINQIPNATSRVGTITLTTYSGSTNIGSSSVPFTVRVPTDVVPTVGTVTLTRNNKDTPAAWGVWVQNHSAAEIEVVGSTGGQGANVSTIKTVVGNWTKWGDQVSFDISGSGTMDFVTTVTDTRGRSASATNTITVEPYEPISLQNISISRGNPNGSSPFDPDAEDGLWGGVKVFYGHTSIGGRNFVKMSVRYRASNSGTWTTAFTDAGVSQNTWERFGDASLSLDNSYIVEVTLSDQFSSQEYTGTISTAFVTMDFLKGGKGVAFGKVSTIPDTVEFDFNVRFNKSVNAVPTGTILPFSGSEEPEYWMLCDGRGLSTTTYAELFDTIGYMYGGERGTFNVPNLMGRVPVGASSSDTEFNTLGKTGGEKEVKLLNTHMPSHSHPGSSVGNRTISGDYSIANGTGSMTRIRSGSTDTGRFSGTIPGTSHDHPLTIASQGGNTPHNNLQPYLTLNYIIYYGGVG